MALEELLHLVRLKTVDESHSQIARALYFFTALGFVYVVVPKDGEFHAAGARSRLSPGIEHQLPSYMVEDRPQMVSNLPGDGRISYS